MSSGVIVLVGLPPERSAGLTDRLRLHGPISHVGSQEVWRSDTDPGELLAALPGLLRRGEVLSAAFLDELPHPDQQWIAVEWVRKIVVSVALEPALSGAMRGWERHGVFERLQIAVHAPPELPRPEPKTVFHDALANGRALSVPYEVPESLDVAARDESWFGEIAAPGNGGVIALLAMSGATGPGRIDLRSLDALHLEVSDELRGNAEQVRSGALRVHAIGLKAQQPVPRDFLERCALDAPHAEGLSERLQAALGDVHGRPESFRLLLHVHAPLEDPEIVIPTGAVFEQVGLNGVQTLAAASSARVMVAPGAVAPIALPAWCLNRTLAPPSGQPVLPTILRYKGQGTQEQVWKDLAERYRASQP